MRHDSPLRPLAGEPLAALPTPPDAPPRRIDSQSLLGAAQEVEINHVGKIYRLRRTSLGKLILTK